MEVYFFDTLLLREVGTIDKSISNVQITFKEVKISNT